MDSNGERSTSWIRATLVLLGVVALYAGLTAVFTWPAARQLDTHLIGGGRDGPMFVWNLWWAAHAVFELGQLPLSTDLLFAPLGTSLSINTHAMLPGVLSGPLQSWWGVVPAFNLSVLSTYVLSGLAGYLLANEVLRDRRAAFLAGVAFAFCHYRTSFVMFHNLIHTELIALWLWALCVHLRTRRWWWAAVAGVFAACLFYTDYNLMVLAGLIGALFVVGATVRSLVSRGMRSTFGLFGHWVILLIVLAGLALPLILEIANEIETHGFYAQMNVSSYDEVSPLHRYLVRGPLQDGAAGLPVRRASYLGWAALGLGLIGWLGGFFRASSWAWLLVFLGFAVTSLGQHLDLTGLVDEASVVGEEGELIRMPYYWLRDVPVVHELRIPHRFGIVAVLALAMLAGAGARVLLRVADRRGTSWANPLAVALPVLVFVDFHDLPFQKLYEMPQVPAALHAIHDDPRDCVVLEIRGGRKGDGLLSYYQTVHEKPVYLSGQIARRIPALEAARDESFLIAELDQIARGKPYKKDAASQLTERFTAEAREQRVGWVILSQRRLSDDQPRLEQSELVGRLRTLHRVIRGALPVEEVVLKPDFEKVVVRPRDAVDVGGVESSILAVYRLSIDEE